MKVLIVEDSKSNLSFLKGCVEDAGLDVITACNGKEAVKMYLQHSPNLILMDVVMPEMDGLEAADLIRKSSKDRDHWLPIILISGMDNDRDIVRGLEAGADDYITKPVSRDVLLAKLNAMHRIYEVQCDLDKLNKELQHNADYDSLTGLSNRNKFDVELNKEWLRALRAGEKLSLCLCDIDNFKRFNEIYGSEAGDHVLRELTMTFEKSFQRPADLVTRYTGGQFAIILPDTDLSGALHTAKRAKKQVEQLGILYEGANSSNMLTISAGISTIDGMKTYPGNVLKGMIRSAEIGLAEAKSQGRDGVPTGIEMTEFA